MSGYLWGGGGGGGGNIAPDAPPFSSSSSPTNGCYNHHHTQQGATQKKPLLFSEKGKTYDFNTADKLNALLIKALVSTGELNEVETYDVDFDHQFL